MTCCAYSCIQYSLRTQYMLLTHADDLLCLQLHTVRSPYIVHTSNPCWWLAVPTAAHSTVSIHSTCFWPMLMTCCAYSCTQYSLHTQYMLVTHVDDMLCLQLHTVQSPYTVHASNPYWWLAVPTAAHSTVSIHSTCLWPMLMTLWRQFAGHVSAIRRIGIIFRRQCMPSECYFLVHDELLTHCTNCCWVVAL